MPVPKRAGGPGGVAILRPKGFTNNQEAMSVMMRALRETRSIAERTARLEMLDMAKVIAQEQKARAPRETGDLESAIQIRPASRSGKNVVIAVDQETAPYARFMNDGMFGFDSIGPDDRYRLGPGSKAKSAGPPHEEPEGVGIRFMERGAEAAPGGLSRRTVAAVGRVVAGMLR